ncbi:MAG: ABC transporter permease, partial [Anaerovorax sp.]
PAYMNLTQIAQSPNETYFFGTDTLGRDIFSMIWYGGRISLFIGVIATIISTFIAVVYGCISGLGNKIIDSALMRFTEIILSIPNILLIIFIQAILGNPSPFSMAVVIGLTGWMTVAKVVRTEVSQIRNSEYILSAKSMGASFPYIMRKHLFPNFLPAILFMVVMNIGSAIGLEASLSFLGLGLPVEVISWGSMMALSERALLSGYWWIILVPGTFMIVTLVCVTNIGNYFRKKGNRQFGNL